MTSNIANTAALNETKWHVLTCVNMTEKVKENTTCSNKLSLLKLVSLGWD